MPDENVTRPHNPAWRVCRIEQFDAQGRGTGPTDTGGRLAIPFTIPGEGVEAEKLRRKEGRLRRILEPSPARTEPACRHFGACGGCAWQHIAYENQLQFKLEKFRDRMAALKLKPEEESLGIVPSPPYGYRNRMDFIWWHDGRFGLRERGKWYSVTDLRECHLLPREVMQTAFEVNRRAHALGLPFRDTKRHTPGLRYLVVRRGVFTGDLLLNLVSDPMELPASLWENLPGVTGVYQLVNDNLENDLSDGVPVHLAGEKAYTERILGHTFRVGPRSFFQPNPAVAEVMAASVRGLVSQREPRGGLIDLYCGIGLFSVCLADQFEHVTGVENNPDALHWAGLNAGGLPISFAAADAEAWLAEPRGGFDTLLVDPPRTGLPSRVIQSLLGQSFRHIVYVSCNPARGLENLAALSGHYRLLTMRLFDQFPQTPHVEMIAGMERRESSSAGSA
ncbi:MAG: 23S rRNA (uracil(1939)-C(5))-methyltransferase RlmD [bacterium]